MTPESRELASITWALVTQVCTSVSTHQSVYVRAARAAICNLTF